MVPDGTHGSAKISERIHYRDPEDPELHGGIAFNLEIEDFFVSVVLRALRVSVVNSFMQIPNEDPSGN
jgi:hypothetical protein